LSTNRTDEREKKREKEEEEEKRSSAVTMFAPIIFLTSYDNDNSILRNKTFQ